MTQHAHIVQADRQLSSMVQSLIASLPVKHSVKEEARLVTIGQGDSSGQLLGTAQHRVRQTEL